jgi:hypothetical protein
MQTCALLTIRHSEEFFQVGTLHRAEQTNLLSPWFYHGRICLHCGWRIYLFGLLCDGQFLPASSLCVRRWCILQPRWLLINSHFHTHQYIHAFPNTVLNPNNSPNKHANQHATQTPTHTPGRFPLTGWQNGVWWEWRTMDRC